MKSKKLFILRLFKSPASPKKETIESPVCEYYLLQADTEASEDLLHVASLLHGDDTQVILLVHPDQEGLVVVVPRGIKPSSVLFDLQATSSTS